MAWPLRIEYEGAVYYVTSRGTARERIFLAGDVRQVTNRIYQIYAGSGLKPAPKYYSINSL